MKGGQIYDLYSELEILRICGDIIQDLLQAGETGCFISNTQTYGTVLAWARKLGISSPTISRRIKSNNIINVKGKDKMGHVCSFYPESTIRQICADILEKRKNP